MSLGCNSLQHTLTKAQMNACTHTYTRHPKQYIGSSGVVLCVLPSIFAGAYKIYGCVEPSDLDATCVRWGWVRFNHGPIRHILFNQQETHKYTERFWFLTGQCCRQMLFVGFTSIENPTKTLLIHKKAVVQFNIQCNPPMSLCTHVLQSRGATCCSGNAHNPEGRGGREQDMGYWAERARRARAPNTPWKEQP